MALLWFFFFFRLRLIQLADEGPRTFRAFLRATEFRLTLDARAGNRAFKTASGVRHFGAEEFWTLRLVTRWTVSARDGRRHL